MSFYVTLPSDSSRAYFPDNTVTHYRTQLHNSINLQGTWEVGIAEILYPHSWYNVRGVCVLNIRNGNIVKSFTLGEGYYRDTEEIIRELDIPDDIGVTFYYKRVINRVAVHVRGGGSERIKIEMTPALCGVLGVDYYNSGIGDANSSKDFFRDEIIYGEHPPNLQPIQNLFIYTDIIPPQYVGDAKVPLIRSVKVSGDHSEYVEKIYDRPHYIKLARGNISSIEIDIRDDLGNPILFIAGKSQVKLHFRRCRYD